MCVRAFTVPAHEGRKKQIPNRSAGIEARFYIIRGYYESTQRTDEHGKPVPMDVLRIGADNINDLMLHLKRFESGLDVDSIRLAGMMRLISGTPYWG